MRRSKSEIYLHFVWATARREPVLTGDVKRAAFRCIEDEARQLGCDVLALGGVEDHAHLLVKTPTTVCAADIAKQTKGVSAVLVRDEALHGEPFHWQEGYGVYSVSASHVARVRAYVERQAERHSLRRTWESLEEIDEDAAAPCRVD